MTNLNDEIREINDELRQVDRLRQRVRLDLIAERNRFSRWFLMRLLRYLDWVASFGKRTRQGMIDE